MLLFLEWKMSCNRLYHCIPPLHLSCNFCFSSSFMSSWINLLNTCDLLTGKGTQVLSILYLFDILLDSLIHRSMTCSSSEYNFIASSQRRLLGDGIRARISCFHRYFLVERKWNNFIPCLLPFRVSTSIYSSYPSLALVTRQVSECNEKCLAL